LFNIDLIPGLIMGFREGLEAFLIIAIMLEYLNKSNKKEYKKYVYTGLEVGIIASLLFGGILFGISSMIDKSSNIAKLWESGSSIVALILITMFIYWMIQNRHKIVSDIHGKMDNSLSKIGLVSLAAIMVAREGAEITLFIFSAVNTNSYVVGTLIGILVASLLVFLIYKSLVKVNLKFIFNITLVYLILQAGFMLGYSIHEFLSFLKAEEILSADNILFTKFFDMSDTLLNHKEQLPGILLYASIGWHSKPEVIQFVIQYLYTTSLLYMFFKTRNK